MLTLASHSLVAAERQLVIDALNAAGRFKEAAALLGITRHSLKRRIIRHGIRWSPKERRVLPDRSGSRR